VIPARTAFEKQKIKGKPLKGYSNLLNIIVKKDYYFVKGGYSACEEYPFLGITNKQKRLFPPLNILK